MSIYKAMFKIVATQKFGKNFTFQEWYAPNTDSVNYTVTNNDRTETINIDSLTFLKNSGESIQTVMRQKLDTAFS